MTTNARTDPETGLRFYEWQGREYPSVTSIRRLIGMPFTLHNWTLSQVIDRAVSDHQLIGAMLTREKRPRERVRDTNVLKEVRAHLRAAATEERDLPGDKGTRAHDAISLGLHPDEVDPDIFGHVVQFRDFMQTMRPTILWSERQVWNLTYGYAGTGDAMMLMPPQPPLHPTPWVCMVDYKTSKGVYIDHAIQLMAYAMAEFVGENGVIDHSATNHLINVGGMAVLHLSENEWEWIEIRSEPRLFQGFLGSLAFAQFLHDYQNKIDPLVAHKIKGGTLVPALAKGLRLIQNKETPDGNPD